MFNYLTFVVKVAAVSPIHAACQLSTEQAPGIVQCLLDYIADPNAPEFPCSQREYTPGPLYSTTMNDYNTLQIVYKNKEWLGRHRG